MRLFSRNRQSGNAGSTSFRESAQRNPLDHYIDLIEGDLDIEDVISILRPFSIAGLSESQSQGLDYSNLDPMLQQSVHDFAETLRLFQGQQSQPPNTGQSPTSVSNAFEPSDASLLRTRPASEGAIARLPRARILPADKRLFAGDTSLCGICCDPLVQGVVLVRLPCSHCYCWNCCIPWLKRTNTCPECRYEVPTDDSKYEEGRIERMASRKTFKCSCHPSGIHSCFFRDPSKPLTEQCLIVEEPICISAPKLVDNEDQTAAP